MSQLAVCVRLFAGLAHDVHAVVGLEEGHEGDRPAEAVVPHGLQTVEALQLLVGQQVHVVQGEPNGKDKYTGIGE
jgi:hypothetical protein